MEKSALADGRRAPFPPDLDTGTPGDDRIPGTDSDDFLYIRKTGADTVRAGDGNDFIDVRDQDGGDLFDGGDGQDTLILNYRGSDVAVVVDLSDPDKPQTLADGTRIVRVERLDFKGGSQNDSVVGGGADFLDGGGGNDTLMGPAAVMYGGAGDDLLIRADEDFDNLDQMSGGAGRDTIFGSNGEEGIAGDAGADVIDAGDGDDSVNGGAGRDIVDAGAGDDIVGVGAEDGIDRLDGGEGDDYLILDRSASDIAFVFTFDDPTARMVLADGTRFTSFEFLAFEGGSGDDQLSGRAHLDGGAGDDTLTAIGDGGNFVDGGDGDDVLNGGEGRDDLSGDAGDDLITTSHDGDFAHGGDGDDTVIGGDGDDSIDAGRGRDDVSAGAGDDVVYALDVFGPKDGPDTLDGGDGRDLLAFVSVVEGVTVNLKTGTGPSGGVVLGFEDISGSYDDDRLTGSAEANVIRGFGGTDTLRGGGGADRFVYGGEVHERDFSGEVDDPDRIADFSRAEGDLIDLSRIAAVRGSRGSAFDFIESDAFSAAGQLRAVESKPGVFVVSGDRDGDAEADFSIVVRSLDALQDSDFIL